MQEFTWKEIIYMANIQGNINQLLALTSAAAYGAVNSKEPDIQKAKEKVAQAKEMKEDLRETYKDYYNVALEDAPENIKEPEGLSSKNLAGIKQGIQESEDLVQKVFKEGQRASAWQAKKQREIIKSPEFQKAKEDAQKAMKEILAKNKAMQSMQTKGLNKIKQKDEYEALYDSVAERYPGISQEAADELVRRYTKMDKGE